MGLLTHGSKSALSLVLPSHNYLFHSSTFPLLHSTHPTFAAMLIDTHTHLFVDAFDEDREAMIQRAKEAGVEAALLPNIDSDSIKDMHDLAAAEPGWALPMLGLHPCSVKGDYKEVLERMDGLFRQRKYYGVGETGLDYYWDKTFVDQQKASLQQHIDWAKEFGLPIVLHTRDSFDDTYKLIRANNDERLTGVFHCFTGTSEDAQKVIELGGFYMGLGGVLTFKNSGLDKSVADIPIDYLVLETDSPYLAPVPHRGKRNETSYVHLVAEKLAAVKELPFAEVARITTENARKLFPLEGIGQ